MALSDILGLSGLGSGWSGYARPEAMQNTTPQYEVELWSQRRAIDALYQARTQRSERIAARKARAAEFRKAQPRKRYKDL